MSILSIIILAFIVAVGYVVGHGNNMDGTNPELVFDAYYLNQHHLIAIDGVELDSGQRQLVWMQAIYKGVDFLADDGGLSAVLGVLTVKLHEDSIKALLEKKILATDLAAPEKQKWLSRLRSLSADSTKHLVLKLVDLGLEQSPQAIDAIKSYL